MWDSSLVASYTSGIALPLSKLNSHHSAEALRGHSKNVFFLLGSWNPRNAPTIVCVYILYKDHVRFSSCFTLSRPRESFGIILCLKNAHHRIFICLQVARALVRLTSNNDMQSATCAHNSTAHPCFAHDSARTLRRESGELLYGATIFVYLFHLLSILNV